ncbi:Uncharacterised protein [Mycobacteroides abscessus subsp. abscessus]|nr:Uncharacterised protein [Mycobacteroides abscessus subsp. abscessus]
MRNSSGAFLFSHFNKLFSNKRPGKSRYKRVFAFIKSMRLKGSKCIFIRKLFFHIQYI